MRARIQTKADGGVSLVPGRYLTAYTFPAPLGLADSCQISPRLPLDTWYLLLVDRFHPPGLIPSGTFVLTEPRTIVDDSRRNEENIRVEVRMIRNNCT